jgi:hypothetical protein
VGFDLVDETFVFPPFVVGGGELDGGNVVRVEYVRDYPDDFVFSISLTVGYLVLNDANDTGLCGVRQVAFSVPRR